MSASPPNAEPFDPMASFGAGMLGRTKKSNAAIYAAIGGVVVLLGGGFLVYKLATGIIRIDVDGTRQGQRDREGRL